MATVLDSLVVELGLDTRKFTEGERSALKSFKKTKDGAADFGKSIEAEGAKISDIFRVVKGGALGIAAAFVGGEGVSFINRVVQMDAATGRLAHTIGLSVQGLSTWQGIVRQVGGSAESATATLAALSDTFAQVQAGQGFFSGPFATLLNRSGVQRGTGPDQALRQIIDYLGKEQASGRMSAQQARFFAESIPGVAGNQDMINVILAGSDALNKWTQNALAAGTANEKSAETAKDFQEQLGILEISLEDVGRGLLRAVNEGPTHGKPFWEWFLSNDKNDATIVPGSIVDKIRNWFTGGNKSLKDLWGDLTGSSTAAASAPQGGAGTTGGADIESYIRQAAIARGIDPNVAVQVYRGEGAGGYVGDRGSSFGPFQLHYGGVAGGGMSVSGLGDTFTKQTGLDARNPSTQKEQIDFALDYAKKNGWGAWHGFKGLPFAGIGGMPTGFGSGGGAGRGSDQHTSISIGAINVSSSKADPAAVAMEVPEAMRRYAKAIPANTGLA